MTQKKKLKPETWLGVSNLWLVCLEGEAGGLENFNWGLKSNSSINILDMSSWETTSRVNGHTSELSTCYAQSMLATILHGTHASYGAAIAISDRSNRATCWHLGSRQIVMGRTGLCFGASMQAKLWTISKGFQAAVCSERKTRCRETGVITTLGSSNQGHCFEDKVMLKDIWHK